MSNPETSSAADWAPFHIDPFLSHRVWGYTDLRPWYDYVAQGEPIGEVWLTGDDCTVASGPHAGTTLGSLFRQSPAALLGAHAPSPDSPLLIKVLFAREKLSVQVHPDDRLAQKYGDPRGKTECWYVLAAEPGAVVAAGLKPGVTLAQVEAEIRDHTLEDSLNLVPVVAGDMIFMDAGTVHAIWPGSILLEVQQNCDLTYRLYDYGRPRELHIEKGLEAICLKTRAGKIPPQQLPDRTVLIDAEYFRIERIPVDGSRTSASLDAGQPGLSYLFAAAGSGEIAGHGLAPIQLPAHSIVAVPAAAPQFVVEDRGGLDLVRITPRWPVNEHRKND